MYAPYNAKMLSDMLLNDLVTNDPIVVIPGGLRDIILGKSDLNTKTYNEIYELAKDLSAKLNVSNIRLGIKEGKRNSVTVRGEYVCFPLDNINLKMVYEVLGGFFDKFECVLRIKEDHAVTGTKPRLKVKVSWKGEQ